MSKTILCADDSVTMQKVAEITFRATEYQYVGAKSADEAVSAAKAGKPVLVLADAEMPGQDGYELCRALKNDPALADVPVLVMCGKSQAYDPAKGAEVGADGHVTKPWDTQVMIDKVAEVLAAGGVAKPEGAGAKPAASATPTPVAAAPAPKIPSIPATPATGRSATIMGMPTIKPPMKAPATPGVTPISSSSPSPIMSKPVPEPAPAPAPAPAAKPAPAPAPKPAPVAAAAPAAGGAVSRPPMIKGVPTRRLKLVPADVADRIAAAAAGAASDLGIDPSSPEMKALLALSANVIERIAWEVIPELAEHMLRENLSDLTAKG